MATDTLPGEKYEISNKEIDEQFRYDKVPYESNPYSMTHPITLKTIGTLFGMNPPAVETARVLELGCASGNNIIPIAECYPKAKVVGVDLAKVQIDAGIEQVKALGLKNIELKHMSITDITPEFGEFDYIICHGIISWVPRFVQDKILEVFDKNLSKNGVAYVSYNTLPGWNMVRSIREMMLYHVQGFEAPAHKIQQARLLLNFIQETTGLMNTPYAAFLKNEAQLLANQPDHYLFHDHLSDQNEQFYFYDILERGIKNNLQYLGDASVASMYLGNMPQKAIDQLKEINDIGKTEQYMDFINNRRFRSTLFCHKEVQLNRNLQNDNIKNFYMQMKVSPGKPLSEIDINNTAETIEFKINNDQNNISTSSTFMKAILYTFAENPTTFYKLDDLTKLASDKLGGKNRVEIKNEFMVQAMKLVLAGILNIYTDQFKITDKINEDKPKAFRVAHYQAANTPAFWVTNKRHERVGLNIVEKYIIKYLDGKNSIAVIVDKLLGHISSKELEVKDAQGQLMTDLNSIKPYIEELVKRSIPIFAHHALLEA